MTIPPSIPDLLLTLKQTQDALTRVQEQATADLITIRDLKAKVDSQQRRLSLLLDALSFLTGALKAAQGQRDAAELQNRELRKDLSLFLSRFDLKQISGLPPHMPLEDRITAGQLLKMTSHLEPNGQPELPLFERNSQ